VTTEILSACKINPTHPIIRGDLQEIGKTLFDIENPRLFSSMLYILPRGRSERAEFALILSEQRDLVLKKLEASHTKFSDFLRSRFFLDQASILGDPASKKEIPNIAKSWKNSKDKHAPYIDAYLYFLTGQ
jgi:hypothetical protein